METVRKIKKAMNTLLFGLCVVIMVLLVLDVSWQVLSRYLFRQPSTFTDEVARFLMIYMSFLGGAYIFGADGHLSVTSLRDKLPAKVKSWVIIFTYALIAAFAVIVMIFGSQRLILRTLDQPSPALGLSMGIFYMILPFSAICIVIYMVLNLIEFCATGKTANQQPEAAELKEDD